MDLHSRAISILGRLLAEPTLRKGKIILVGHSLGGLVIKEMLRIAHDEAPTDSRMKQFLRRVDKVVFIATPHLGADLAVWALRFSIFVRPSSATACLARNDPNLQNLNQWYGRWSSKQKIAHLILYESEPTKIFGVIVKPDSATPLINGPLPTQVIGDHSSICRPPNRSHDTFVRVRDFIQPKGSARSGDEVGRAAKDPDVRISRLVEELTRSGEVDAAKDAGIDRETIFQLARRIDSNVEDFDQALRELERAVELAVSVSDDARRLDQDSSTVRQTLLSIATKSSAGEFDAAADEATKALVRWQADLLNRYRNAVPAAVALLRAGLAQDILRRDHVSAAKRIVEMAELERPGDRLGKMEILDARYDEFYTSGKNRGLKFDLMIAVQLAHSMVNLAFGPVETCNALNSLGLALLDLGERETDTTSLEASVKAHEFALTTINRGEHPQNWVRAQLNLGNSFYELGARRDDHKLLLESAKAYRAALAECTREASPETWSKIQSNLGTALFSLSDHVGKSLFLEQAIDAYRLSLDVRSREDFPTGWATTRNNIGKAFLVLGEREGNVEQLKEAVAAFDEAAAVFHQEVHLSSWATAVSNYGDALRAHGEVEKDGTVLSLAVEACRSALVGIDQVSAPWSWAACQLNLGNAARARGELLESQADLREAVQACRAASAEFVRSEGPLNWAHSRHLLGNAMRALGEFSENDDLLEEAKDACAASLLEFSREKTPFDWAAAQCNLGRALRARGVLQQNPLLLAEAVGVLEIAQRVATNLSAPRLLSLVKTELKAVNDLIDRLEG